MAHSKSARKRVRQNVKARLRNRRRKDAVKDTVREYEAALAAGQKEQAAGLLKEAYRKLDRMSCQGVVHRNTAARKKSRLARRLAKLQGTPAA